MKSLSTVVFCGAFALALAISPVAVHANPAVTMIEPAKLERMSKDASTPEQHANVARQYRLHAESLEAKATRHETEVKKLQARPRSALEYKWPAFARKPWQAEQRLAEEARSEARDAQQVAARHVQLAVEARFTDAGSN